LGPNDERYYFLLQYSVVGLEATDWTTEELWCDSWKKQEIYFFSKAFGPAVGAHIVSYSIGTRTFPPTYILTLS
jgi:hypothetical protein